MSDAVIVAMVASVPATIAAIGAVLATTAARKSVLTGEQNKEHIQQLTVNVDGRLTKLLETTAEAARLSGVADEREIAAERAARVAADTTAAIAGTAPAPADAGERA